MTLSHSLLFSKRPWLRGATVAVVWFLITGMRMREAAVFSIFRYTVAHGISGVSDCFLQIRLFGLLRHSGLRGFSGILSLALIAAGAVVL